MIKAVLFDMDGTLLDTESTGLKAWQYIIDKYDLNLDLTLPIKSIGLNNKSMSELFYNELGAEFPFEKYWKEGTEYLKNYEKEHGIIVKNGFEELSAYLKKCNIKMLVATSTYHNSAIEKLKKAGIYEHFDGLIGGDEIENGKPAPDIFLECAKLAGYSTKECLVVEDSENGVRSALAADIRCIYIKDIKDINGELKSKVFRECKDLSQIIEVIKEVNFI